MKGYRNLSEALRAIFGDDQPHTLSEVLRILRHVGFRSKSRDIPGYVRLMIRTALNGCGGKAYEEVGQDSFRALPVPTTVIRNRDRSLNKLRSAIEEMHVDGPYTQEVVGQNRVDGVLTLDLKCGHQARRTSKIFISTFVLCHECREAAKQRA